jgi:hypothetical protein
MPYLCGCRGAVKNCIRSGVNSASFEGKAPGSTRLEARRPIISEKSSWAVTVAERNLTEAPFSKRPRKI